MPPAHPAEQAELRSMNTALETASHPSAPLLPTCTPVLAAGGTVMIKMLRSQPGELFKHQQGRQLIYAEITIQIHCCVC